ncbi:MAG: YbhB/YbcL family Raf kinase inhibitor-like protein [Solirubrobacterales bacterium]
MPKLGLKSDSFEYGEPIPERHTCSADGASPPLTWSFVPEGTRTMALVLHDPDAPSGDFVHWLAWNIDPADGGIEGDKPAPAEGTNGFGRPGYAGPCPPPGHGPHRYYFQLYALDTELDLDPGAAREQLDEAMKGHVLAEAELMGIFKRT